MLDGGFTECQEKKWLYKHSIYKNSRVTLLEECFKWPLHGVGRRKVFKKLSNFDSVIDFQSSRKLNEERELLMQFQVTAHEKNVEGSLLFLKPLFKSS